MSNITATDLDESFQMLLAILARWGKPSKAESENQVDSLLVALKRRGWRRKDIYALLQRTCNPQLPLLPTESIDYICDVETSVTGCVDVSAVMRFEDEQFTDPDKLLVYVRSGAWKKT